MKIRLIEPKPPGHHIFSMAKLPRLGLPLIGTRLAQLGHDVLIYVEDLAPIDMEDCVTADLIGISSTTSTANRAYELADEFHRAKTLVIIGGPHVTFMPEEALNHADMVAQGEGGLEIMVEVVSALEKYGSYKEISEYYLQHDRYGVKKDGPLDHVKGLTYRVDGGGSHFNWERCRDTVLDELPFPDFSLIHHHEKMSSTPIMTSWGCPFDCNFCSVTAMFGKKYRFRSAENVMGELREKRPKKVFFYDDNLAANKKRLKELLRMIIAENLNIKWTAQVRSDVTKDEELLRLMRDSGCWTVYVGFESISQATLDSYHKSQDVQDIIDAIEKFHQYKIRIHGMFVLGADTDPSTVVEDTVDFALKHGIDTIMLNSLTPLPGTVQYQELEEAGRIFNNDWSYYDALHVVFYPKTGSPYHFQMEGIKGYKRFYSLRTVAKHFLRGRFRAAYYAFWGWLIVNWWLADARNEGYLEHLKLLYSK